MRRTDLEHILRAAADVVGRRALLVIGSQSVLGSWAEHELPAAATMSAEVDLAPISGIDRSRLDTALRAELDAWYPEAVDEGVDPETISDGLEVFGEWSDFHESFDVDVQGVGTETAVLPDGWEGRLVVLTGESTGYAAGLCLDPVDACAAKLVAGREHDYEFVQALIAHGNVTAVELHARTLRLPADHPRTPFAQAWAASTSTDG